MQLSNRKLLIQIKVDAIIDGARKEFFSSRVKENLKSAIDSGIEKAWPNVSYQELIKNIMNIKNSHSAKTLQECIARELEASLKNELGPILKNYETKVMETIDLELKNFMSEISEIYKLQGVERNIHGEILWAFVNDMKDMTVAAISGIVAIITYSLAYTTVVFGLFPIVNPAYLLVAIGSALLALLTTGKLTKFSMKSNLSAKLKKNLIDIEKTRKIPIIGKQAENTKNLLLLAWESPEDPSKGLQYIMKSLFEILWSGQRPDGEPFVFEDGQLYQPLRDRLTEILKGNIR